MMEASRLSCTMQHCMLVHDWLCVGIVIFRMLLFLMQVFYLGTKGVSLTHLVDAAVACVLQLLCGSF